MTKALTADEAMSVTNGTHLQGYIIATRSQIEKAVGTPTFRASDFGDGKVTTEWVLDFGNGVVATVYDWKRYDLGAPEISERIEWNVGGHTHEVLPAVERTLGVIARGWRN